MCHNGWRCNEANIEAEIQLFTDNMIEFDYDDDNIRYCEKIIIELENKLLTK